ncbi:MAG TPA: hypothetical protein DC058_16860 [Planctomycetaceae bacterium]|nr:hypothetical protein [Planctomycetaceae bacterium]HBC62869.1 hypothetical protein [Planctomycetaceae bacterium]
MQLYDWQSGSFRATRDTTCDFGRRPVKVAGFACFCSLPERYSAVKVVADPEIRANRGLWKPEQPARIT